MMKRKLIATVATGLTLALCCCWKSRFVAADADQVVKPAPTASREFDPRLKDLIVAYVSATGDVVRYVERQDDKFKNAAVKKGDAAAATTRERIKDPEYLAAYHPRHVVKGYKTSAELFKDIASGGPQVGGHYDFYGTCEPIPDKSACRKIDDATWESDVLSYFKHCV